MSNSSTSPIRRRDDQSADHSANGNGTTKPNPPIAMSHSEIDRQLKQLAGMARKSVVKSVEAMLQLAGIIAAANSLLSCRGRSSEFGRWVTEKVGISRSRAYELIRVHATWLDYEFVGQIGLTALAKLSGGSAAAIEEAKQLAELGERVSLDDARKLIAKHSKKLPPPKTVRLSVDGLATIIVHCQKNADSEDLSRLQQLLERAIRDLAKKEETT